MEDQHRGHAGTSRRREPGAAVLEHDTRTGRHAQSGRGPQVALGIRLRGPVVAALAMAAGAAGAVYVAEHGQELFEALDADEALSRATEKVGAES